MPGGNGPKRTGIGKLNETKISETECAEICRSNYPAAGKAKTKGCHTSQLALDFIHIVDSGQALVYLDKTNKSGE